MNKQELARELGHSGAQKLLSRSMARLDDNGHDGFPRVIPVQFYWTGERIVVSTAPTSPKIRALSSRPDVALTIDTGSTPEESKALLVGDLA
jgi:nitroimidazol reductase NimA-like FMN-containing flavoprotein (pyridoxamine 5'-phosphate oxidase superfamily)